jgi:hypothetical protein
LLPIIADRSGNQHTAIISSTLYNNEFFNRIGRQPPVTWFLVRFPLLTQTRLLASTHGIIMKALLSTMLVVLSSLTVSGENTCDVGDKCTISGVISIYRTPPAFTATLDLGATCVPLALPDSVYSDADLWSGKQVIIRGEALPNYSSDDAVLTYEVSGRNVIAAVCGANPYILFVDEISLTK